MSGDAGGGADAVCSHCGKSQAELKALTPPVKLKPCPCRMVRYCDASCQRAHWPQHKTLCPHSKAATKEKYRITLVIDGNSTEVELRGAKPKVSDIRQQVPQVGSRGLRHAPAGRPLRDTEVLAEAGIPAGGTVEVTPELNAQFKGKDMRHAQAPGLEPQDLDYHDLTDCVFDKMVLKQWRFCGADLTNASFANCDLRESTFDAATKLHGTKLYAAQLPSPFDARGMDMTDCVLWLCDLGQMTVDPATVLIGADFDEAKLPGGTQLANKDLSGCRFAKCDLSAVKLDGATIIKAYFTGATGVDHAHLRQRGAISWD